MNRSTLPIALLLTSVLAILFLVSFTHLFLYPQITATVDEQLIDETYRSADVLATHLKQSQSLLNYGEIPPLFLADAKSLLWKIHAQKIRLFSSQGEIIYSSDSDEIGQINSLPYLQKIIAEGTPQSTLIENERLSAEGLKSTLDLVEVYLPLINGTEHLGVIEVYNDVSIQKSKLRRLINLSSRVVNIATLILILSFGIFFLLDRRNRKIRKQTEQALLKAESEHKYRDLFENAMDSLFILDDQFRYIDANPMATEVFGYSHTDFLQMSVFDVIPVDQVPRSQEEFEQLRKRGSYKNFIGQMRTRDGRWLDVEINSSVIIENGKMAGSRDVVRDITERKKLEREFAQARNLDALGILAGGIAHDFNNLLTSVLGNISLTKILPTSDAKSEKYLSIAENAVLRAKDLTLQLLTFSQGGGQHKKVVSLTDLVRTSAAFPLTGSNIRCEFDLAEDLKPALIDSNQISQVIQNLILNAREAMPDGGHIMISGTNISLPADNEFHLPESDYISLIFIDTGVGIEDKFLPQIFDPYFSTKERDTRKGMGLGLSICHSIIIDHHGCIDVESYPEQGTRFQILLPATNDPIAEENHKEPAALHRSLNILIMDDEEIIREVATELLNHDGHRTTCVEDGSEAISAYSKKMNTEDPFDLVILDLTIPGGMGGVETLERLTALDPDVIALVSSGYVNDSTRTDYMNHGFSGSANKPYSIQTLRQELERLFPHN